MAKVSIIVPVYNSEKTLAACLGNLVHQTLEDIEIILVNDCSTDNSLQILLDCEAQFSDKVIVVNSDKNRGAGGARNVGLQYAGGEYIGFVDSDDIVTVDMYEKMYSKAKEGDYDVVDCGYYDERKDEAIIHTSDDLTGELNADKRSKLIACDGYLCTKIFRKEFLDDINFTFRENCILEDWETRMLIFAKAKNVGNVKEILYYYKYYEASSSRKDNADKQFTDAMSAIEAMASILIDLDIYPDIQEAVELRIITLCVIFANLYDGEGVSKEVKKQKLEKISRYTQKYVKIPLDRNKFVNTKINVELLAKYENVLRKYTPEI